MKVPAQWIAAQSTCAVCKAIPGQFHAAECEIAIHIGKAIERELGEPQNDREAVALERIAGALERLAQLATPGALPIAQITVEHAGPATANAYASRCQICGWFHRDGEPHGAGHGG